MKKAEKTMLAETFRKLATDVMEIADVLEGKASVKEAVTPETIPEQTTPVTESTTTESTTPEQSAPKKTYTFEEARAILADKARAGFKTEIKDILAAHGFKKLSEITDPAKLALVVKDAEGIGVND